MLTPGPVMVSDAAMTAPAVGWSEPTIKRIIAT